MFPPVARASAPPTPELATQQNENRRRAAAKNKFPLGGGKPPCHPCPARMTLAPVWRTRLFATGAAFVAVWMGSAIAQQDFVWPVLFAAGVACITLVTIQPLPLTTLLLGGALCGYIVGNRGFAQISASERLPLLPAELVILVGCSLLVVRSALQRELPFRRDPLNYAILLWIIIGACRLPFDLRLNGITAVRDFALVYYAVFFFLTQHAASTTGTAGFLHGCFAVSAAILLLTQHLFERFPDFFLGTLTFRNTPLIFYKGDLAGTSMALGSVVFFLSFERQRRWWQLGLSLALAAGAFTSNNRASMISLVGVAVLLLLGRRWRFAATLGAAGIITAAIMLLVAYFGDKPWQQTPVFGAYERIVSVIDPFGARDYSGEGTFNKGDNNRFRTVWWRIVLDETIESNPWFGLGFGHDIAARFAREYYADANEEFSARSPHNVWVTVFARMGAVGLLCFLVMTCAAVRRALRAVREGPSQETAFWCIACVMLTSACFGVVLEGPMGAVLFWVALGAASAQLPDTSAEPAETPELAVAEAAGEA